MNSVDPLREDEAVPSDTPAATLFVLPGLVALLGLSYIYVGFHEVHIVQSPFFGLKAAVLAIVAEAVRRIGHRASNTRLHVAIAALALISKP